MKLCKDCRHYVEDEDLPDRAYGKCAHPKSGVVEPESAHPVTGEVRPARLWYAETRRTFDWPWMFRAFGAGWSCGPDAHGWEAK